MSALKQTTKNERQNSRVNWNLNCCLKMADPSCQTTNHLTHKFNTLGRMTELNRVLWTWLPAGNWECFYRLEFLPQGKKHSYLGIVRWQDALRRMWPKEWVERSSQVDIVILGNVLPWLASWFLIYLFEIWFSGLKNQRIFQVNFPSIPES